MRKTIAAVAGLLIAAVWAQPVSAGGGGRGGVCAEEPPLMSLGTVAVGDNCFSPVDASIQSGDTLRWQVTGSPGAHTVTFADGPESGGLADTFAVRFNEPGRFAYSCIYHPGMVGTVDVSGAPVASGSAFEVFDEQGNLVERFDLAGTSAPASSDEMLISLDPLAASVILLLGLPMSLAATMRLVGFPRRSSRIRLQLPWRVAEPAPPPRARR